MSQNEDPHKPDHFTCTQFIEAPVESTPSSGDHRTSTSTTTRKTSDSTYTTEPPFHHSEIDEYLCSTEFMEEELLNKTQEFLNIWIILHILIILTLSYYTFFLKIIPLDIGLSFIVGMTLLFPCLNDLFWE